MTTKIAVIGDADTVVGFRLAGILKATISSDSTTARTALSGYAQDQEVFLVIITERLAEQIRDTIEEISAKPYPVIVEIPDKRGRLEERENPLRRLVKRAIGVELEGF